MITNTVRFLGTGAAWGHPVAAKHACAACSRAQAEPDNLKNFRGRSSFVVSAGGMNVLVDAGPDIRSGLIREKIDSIDALLVTHAHADHIAGIDDTAPFRIAGMPTFASQYVRNVLMRNAGYLFNSESPLKDANPLSPIDLPGFPGTITPFSVYHGPDAFGSGGSLGYVIETGGKKLVYSGDLHHFGSKDIEGPVPEIVENADLLIFETNWFNEPAQQPPNPHMSFQRALNYFSTIQGTHRIVLTHISHEDWSIPENNDRAWADKMLLCPAPLDHDEWQDAARKIGEERGFDIKVAYDGMTENI